MDELLRWCRVQREMMLDTLRRMEALELRFGEVRVGGEAVDKTQEWVAVLRGRIVELDQVLATYKPK